jgi:hypothetical protein
MKRRDYRIMQEGEFKDRYSNLVLKKRIFEDPIMQSAASFSCELNTPPQCGKDGAQHYLWVLAWFLSLLCLKTMNRNEPN